MDALVIIDVQQGMFTFPGYAPHDGEAVVARIEGLLDGARRSGMPVFFVQHQGAEGDPLAAGSRGFAFREELAPRAEESVTVKRYCSAFQETDFDRTLKAAGIDHLIVCGMQTEMCVDTAVRAAVERGYRITLVSDGHTTFDTKTLSAAKIIAHHNATLGDGFATLKKADDIAFTQRTADEIRTARYTIEAAETNDAQTRKIVSDALMAFNESLFGPPNIRPLTLSVRSADGSVIGGILGRTSRGWLFVELLFVPKGLRGQGLGDRLLATAEAEGRKRGCIGAWLDTFNPDARRFYEKRGYALCGEITDNPPGHGRYFMRKRFDAI